MHLCCCCPIRLMTSTSHGAGLLARRTEQIGHPATCSLEGCLYNSFQCQTAGSEVPYIRYRPFRTPQQSHEMTYSMGSVWPSQGGSWVSRQWKSASCVRGSWWLHGTALHWYPVHTCICIPMYMHLHLGICARLHAHSGQRCASGLPVASLSLQLNPPVKARRRARQAARAQTERAALLLPTKRVRKRTTTAAMTAPPAAKRRARKRTTARAATVQRRPLVWPR